MKLIKVSSKALSLIALLVISTVAVLLSFNESVRDGVVTLAVLYLLHLIYNTLDDIADTLKRKNP